ncbi:MAG TPA: transglycosylase SLT domain-containing protein, partial [Pyrinomonadaceae bacterium]|nr:transglycosylase SLT domain-containing protein [Pyrinomonadaceae bacterium]
DLAALGQATSAIDFNFTINPLIQQYINYYQGRGRSTMETGLRRSGRYMRMARRIFREEGVPEDIAWLGQVESAWRTMALSSAAASGLWQFVPSTGRAYGLRQTAWVDERNSIEQSTRASAHYLKWLANRYNGNWELAMAAYNTGEGNVDRAIQQAGTASFWAIYPYIAQQTRNYVPNILATILIAKQPDRYGFRNIRPDAPLAYDVVKVPSATSLQLIADMADTSVAALRELNPQLRRDITPRGEASNILIPAGKAHQLQALLRRVPLERRETARMITIAPGEDLQAVAERTGTSLAVLQAMNGGVDTRATNRLVVPNSSVRPTVYTRAGANTNSTAQAGPRTVKARAGDTIAKIAQANHVSADDVARLNNATPDTVLQAGREVLLPASAQQQQSAPAPRRRR